MSANRKNVENKSTDITKIEVKDPSLKTFFEPEVDGVLQNSTLTQGQVKGSLSDDISKTFVHDVNFANPSLASWDTIHSKDFIPPKTHESSNTKDLHLFGDSKNKPLLAHPNQNNYSSFINTNLTPVRTPTSSSKNDFKFEISDFCVGPESQTNLLEMSKFLDVSREESYSTLLFEDTFEKISTKSVKNGTSSETLISKPSNISFTQEKLDQWPHSTSIGNFTEVSFPYTCAETVDATEKKSSRIEMKNSINESSKSKHFREELDTIEKENDSNLFGEQLKSSEYETTQYDIHKSKGHTIFEPCQMPNAMNAFFCDNEPIRRDEQKNCSLTQNINEHHFSTHKNMLLFSHGQPPLPINQTQSNHSYISRTSYRKSVNEDTKYVPDENVSSITGKRIHEIYKSDDFQEMHKFIFDGTITRNTAQNRPETMEKKKIIRTTLSTSKSINNKSSGRNLIDKQINPCKKGRGRPKRDPKEGWPKRPLSAYNIFFKCERERMLHTTRQTLPQPNQKTKINRKDRPAKHGIISFGDLAKTIGSRWKNLSKEEKRPFEVLASCSMHHYKDALARFNEKRNKKNNEGKQKK